MILESANGTFSRVNAMFVGGYSLESDLMPKEGIFESLGALVVEDV